MSVLDRRYLALRSRQRVCGLALVLGLGLGGLAAGQEEPAPRQEQEPLVSATLDGGGALAELNGLLEVLAQDPADPRVALLLGELGRRQALSGAEPAALSAILREALPRSGWNHDSLLGAAAQFEVQGGRVDEARALLTRRGVLNRFLVCGPFGLAPRASLGRPFPPEQAANRKQGDPSETFRGQRGRELAWHELVANEPGVAPAPGSELEGTGAVVYALTHVQLEGDAPRQVWLSYRGPSAWLWVNRERVAEIDRSAARLPQRVRVPLELRPGWNRILFKLSGGTDARFAAQLCDSAGTPLVLPAAFAQEVAPGRAGLAELHPRAALEALAEETTPQRRALYAWLLASEGLSEEALHVLDALGEDTPGVAQQAWYQLVLGRVAAEASHLPVSVRRNRSRAAFEAALRLEPQARAAAIRLATFDLAEDRILPAIKRLEERLEANPADLGLRIRLCAALLGQGWWRPAQDLIDATLQEQRGRLPVLEARVRLLQAQGRDEELLPIYDQIRALNASRVEALQIRVRRAVARGGWEEARQAQDALDEATHADPSQRAAAARSLARAFGRDAQGLAATQRWASLEPEAPLRRLALADRLAREAERDPAAKAEALRLLNGLVEETPGNFAARRLRDGLRGGEERFWEAWEPDLNEVLGAAPEAKTWPRANRVCLFDQQVTRIYADTSSEDYVHRIWRLLDEAGTQALAQRPAYGETQLVRTITPDGQILEPIQAKEGTFQLPGLSPGAAVQQVYRTRQGPADFQFESGPFYFMDPDLQEPFWLSRWVIEVHKDAPVEIVSRNLDRPGIRHEVRERGEWRVHIFEARHQPRVEPEPGAPGRDELLPWVRVIERKRLDELDGLYRERALRGRAAAPSVNAKAQALVEGLEGDEAKAEKLLAFVHEHVAAPGQDSDPARVLASRSGSKSALYRALLRAAEVPHALAFAARSPHARTRTDWTVPELGQFGIPLVRIAPRGGEPYYVIPAAARLAPRRRLPAALWDAPVYVAAEEGGFLEVLPTGRLEDEAIRTKTRIALREDGGGQVIWRQELGGFNYFRLKEQLQAAQEGQIRGYFARQLNQLFPGARLRRYALPGLKEVGVPVRWKLEGDAAQLLQKRQDGTLWLGGLLAPSQLAARFGALRERTFALAFEEPVVVRDTTDVFLGDFACPNLPQELRINERLLQYSLRVTRPAPDRVRLERHLVLRPGRIAPAEYAHFREQLRRIAEAEQAGLSLEARAR